MQNTIDSARRFKRLQLLFCLWFTLFFCLLLIPQAVPAQEEPDGSSSMFLPVIIKSQATIGVEIGPVTTNLNSYPNSQIPTYQKLELTFNVTTTAKNLQLPYDPNPPSGLEPGLGITVNALFTPDNWQTVYTQPAFYYQEFEHTIKDNRDWIYPTDRFAWKVRFSPNQTGTWQYKLIAQDASGRTETLPQTFSVAASTDKGFIRISPQDSRYFEFENGEPFLGLGYNLTFGELDWNSPTVSNEPKFQAFQANGLQLFRTWLSHWGIFTSAWNPWDSPLPERHAQYVPYSSLSMDSAYPGSDVSMALIWQWNPGMFLGFLKQPPAVKPNTAYQISIRYLIPQELKGPRISGHPYGLVAKTGDWLTGPGSWPDNIYGFVDPGTGEVISAYAFKSPTPQNGAPQWSILEGEIITGNQNFLPRLYLVLENIVDGTGQNGGGNVVYIDRVEVREKLGNGQYGPNIVSKPWMAHHLYFEQRNSYAFDKTLELAEKYDIYLKLVVLEKNEWILNRIDYEGHPIPDDPNCWDEDPGNNPEKCPDNRWFYGNWRAMTKVRWLQQAWWRYLQARWGYSTHLHSWELLNEGDPFNGLHYSLADEFGRYMHQFTPNKHLVTTSFWHSFPRNEFWANPDYPHLDYADLHAYATESTDTAADSQYYSTKHGAKQSEGANKPLIRGETGFSDEVLQDITGVWLHNYIWAGVNSGGMYEQYWYGKEHIEQGNQGHDLRYHYQPFRNFLEDIPLNNGVYQDIQAVTSNNSLRAWGQKDLAHGCAHLWVQNKGHTWKNVIDGVSIPVVSGRVEIPGFQANKTYTLEWWDPYQPTKAKQIVRTDVVTPRADGTILISVNNLVADTALKISPIGGCPRS